MDETLKELGEMIVGACGGALSGYTVAFSQLTLDARADDGGHHDREDREAPHRAPG